MKNPASGSGQHPDRQHPAQQHPATPEAGGAVPVNAAGASSLHAKQDAWSGRFAEPVAQFVLRYTASVGFDQRLAAADISGSRAHAAMLEKIGVLSAADLAAITSGLDQIAGEIDSGHFAWRLDLEDVHLNIEARLTELAGDAGKRLHTGRSRNDQVATDLRLFLRGAIDHILAELRGLQIALLDLAAAHVDTVLPGFTHLQVAQPVVLGHHLLAYVEMLGRDAERLREVRARVNRLPLGAAALAGTGFPIDREFVARALGFDEVCRNSMDAVSDRDFVIEFCGAAALAMVHLSRFAEELILWVNPRFGFISLPDRFTTGSSIMPQKRNPDVPELARGKTGRVVGSLVALLMVVKGQPLAYNKDNQEDKEPLFDAVDTLRDTLHAFAELVPGIVVHPQAMRRAALEGYATATDLADYLVRRGLPFRDAHEAVGRAVRRAAERGCELAQLPLAELREFAPGIEADALPAMTLEGSVAARNHLGGTAPAQVARQIAYWRARLA
jgi:argininosuccinate lyase